MLDLFFTARARDGLDGVARATRSTSACGPRPRTIDPATLAFPTTRAAFARYRERRVPRSARRLGRAIAQLHVVLVEPEIHWNTGNAGRTCLAAGAQLHLVEPLGFSLDERELRRAGLDYWERVRAARVAGLAGVRGRAARAGRALLRQPRRRARELWHVRYPERTVLVFGRESVGLPAAIRERYRDRLVRLPMHDPGLRSRQPLDLRRHPRLRGAAPVAIEGAVELTIGGGGAVFECRQGREEGSGTR